jgi:hypothetical protein
VRGALQQPLRQRTARANEEIEEEKDGDVTGDEDQLG